MKPYWKITIAYLAFGVLWIFLTDRIAHSLSMDLNSLTHFQTIKGWIYVTLSGFLIFFYSKKSCDNLIKQEKAKLRVFKKAIEGARHILLNYLNQMQLVTLEAENCKDFDPETLVIAKQVSREASEELILLEKLNDASLENIHSVVYKEGKAVHEAA